MINIMEISQIENSKIETQTSQNVVVKENKFQRILMDLLHKCNIPVEKDQQLEGMLIPRDIFLNDEKYEELAPFLEELRTIFSSSSLTSMQKTAGKNQKWPLLNLVRQILKWYNYKMSPVRKSNGYDKTGKKKYLRFFKIEKLKKI